MINAVLVFNNTGQPRLTKFYTQLVSDLYADLAYIPTPPSTLPLQAAEDHRSANIKEYTDSHDQDTAVQQRLLSEIFTLVSARPATACNFLPLPPLLAAAHSSSTVSPSPSASIDQPSLVTYRHYATLYFIVISTATESPLALLDLIQVFVVALNQLFRNVCELDLIFNYEALHAVLAEMVVGGVVVETQLDRVVQGVRAQGSVPKRPVNEPAAPVNGGGGGVGGGSTGIAGGLASGIWASR